MQPTNDDSAIRERIPMPPISNSLNFLVAIALFCQAVVPCCLGNVCHPDPARAEAHSAPCECCRVVRSESFRAQRSSPLDDHPYDSSPCPICSKRTFSVTKSAERAEQGNSGSVSLAHDAPAPSPQYSVPQPVCIHQLDPASTRWREGPLSLRL